MIMSLISRPMDHYLTVEKPVHIVVQEEEEDPINFDPYLGPFLLVEDVFNKSICSIQVQLDQVIIPKDNCKYIAEAIVRGSARIVSDGSFDPETKKGTAALIMTVGTTNKNLLKAATWTPGMEGEQSAY